MIRMILFTMSLLFLSWCGLTQSVQDKTDSAAKEKTAEPKTQVKSTARIHTRGMFLYGGRISTDNPAFDINFVYNRKQWGLIVYKAIDLKDHTSPNNFALALV